MIEDVENIIRTPLVKRYIAEFGRAGRFGYSEQHDALALVWAEEQATNEINNATNSEFLHMVSNAIERRLQDDVA